MTARLTDAEGAFFRETVLWSWTGGGVPLGVEPIREPTPEPTP